MLDRFKNWYADNYSQISWFLIGFLTLDVLVRFGRGEFGQMFISIILVALQYALVRRK